MFEKEAEEYIKANNLEWELECHRTSPIGEVKQAYLAGAEPRERLIKELEAQIEKMKCCANCVFSESDRLNGTFCHKEGCFVLASAKCKLWDN